MNELTRLSSPREPQRAEVLSSCAPSLARRPSPPSVNWSQSPAGVVNLNDVFSRMWHAKWILFAGSVLGTLAAVSLSAVVAPVYRARTSIRLEQIHERFPNLPEMLSSESAPAAEAYLQNELRVIESNSLAKRVALSLGLNAFPPKREGGLVRVLTAGLRMPAILGPPSESADDLLISYIQKALTVRPSLKSQVIDISFDARDPGLAARGANAVVTEYIAMNHEARMETTHNNNEWLTQQIADLKTKLDRGNAELQAFARLSGLLYGTNQNLLSEERAREIQEELSKAQAERTAKQAYYEAASTSLEALPADADGGLLREYESKLAAVKAELLQLRSLYTSAHYKVAAAQARQAQLEADIRTERQRIVARMGAELDAAKHRESAVASSYRAVTSELGEQTAAAFRYTVLKKDLENTEVLYNSLLQKVKEATVTSALNAVNVRVIDPALPPSTPRSPNIALNSSIGFTTGLLLAAGLVLIRKRDAIPGSQAEWNELGIRELGAIPHVRHVTSARSSITPLRLTKPSASVEMVTWYEQPSGMTEAFRSAITSIVFSPALEGKRNVVLTVTSVRPEEGKTTTLSNLGIALAETHGRVLLVDGDLRRSRVHEIFGLCNDRGLSTILTGDEPVATMALDTLIQETNIPRLSVLPSGPGAASIPPLLYSARMTALIHRLRQAYDYVLIDTPPKSLFADARILGRQSDGVLLVVQAARLARSELTTIYRDLLDDGTSVVGAILNRCKPRIHEYENYRYKA